MSLLKKGIATDFHRRIDCFYGSYIEVSCQFACPPLEGVAKRLSKREERNERKEKVIKTNHP